MRRSAVLATLAALLAAALTLGITQVLLSGSGGSGADLPPVAVDVPAGLSRGELSAELACARLGARLPDEVAGGAQRFLTPPDVTAAAWGDPPVVLRCGVTAPPGYDPSVQTVAVDGVNFFLEQDARRATVVDRAVYVEVATPPDVAVADVLSPIARAVQASLPFDDGRQPG